MSAIGSATVKPKRVNGDSLKQTYASFDMLNDYHAMQRQRHDKRQVVTRSSQSCRIMDRRWLRGHQRALEQLNILRTFRRREETRR